MEAIKDYRYIFKEFRFLFTFSSSLSWLCSLNKCGYVLVNSVLLRVRLFLRSVVEDRREIFFFQFQLNVSHGFCDSFKYRCAKPNGVSN